MHHLAIPPLPSRSEIKSPEMCVSHTSFSFQSLRQACIEMGFAYGSAAGSIVFVEKIILCLNSWHSHSVDWDFHFHCGVTSEHKGRAISLSMFNSLSAIESHTYGTWAQS